MYWSLRLGLESELVATVDLRCRRIQLKNGLFLNNYVKFEHILSTRKAKEEYFIYSGWTSFLLIAELTSS
jgi:hypothetical protein